VNSYYAVRHRERTDMFLDPRYQWVSFHAAMLHVFETPGLLVQFAAGLRPEVELVEVFTVPVRQGLN